MTDAERKYKDGEPLKNLTESEIRQLNSLGYRVKVDKRGNLRHTVKVTK